MCQSSTLFFSPTKREPPPTKTPFSTRFGILYVFFLGEKWVRLISTSNTQMLHGIFCHMLPYVPCAGSPSARPKAGASRCLGRGRARDPGARAYELPLRRGLPQLQRCAPGEARIFLARRSRTQIWPWVKTNGTILG